jgi:hypothetical protein
MYKKTRGGRYWWILPLILVTLEAEIRRLYFRLVRAEKFSRPHLNGKLLGMVACTCHPHYNKKHKIGESQSRPA